MLETHYIRVARDAANKERDGQFDLAARKWHKAMNMTNNLINISWCKAREAHCWKMAGEAW